MKNQHQLTSQQWNETVTIQVKMNVFQKLLQEKRYEELSQLEKYVASWKYKQQILRIYEEQSKKLKIGYFAQHQTEELISEASAFEHLQKLHPNQTETRLRSHLGNFGFEGKSWGLFGCCH